jgi:hypothetical protein
MQDLFISYSLDTFLPGYDLSGNVPSTIYLILANGQVAAAPTGCLCSGEVTKKNQKTISPPCLGEALKRVSIIGR